MWQVKLQSTGICLFLHVESLFLTMILMPMHLLESLSHETETPGNDDNYLMGWVETVSHWRRRTIKMVEVSQYELNVFSL